jgi:hypothetical protein
MPSKINRLTSPWLLAAGLMAGVAAAHAASNFTVTATQETLVKPGMSSNDVRLAIGHPDRIGGNFDEPVLTWTYKVAGATGREVAVFDVDFGADGRVESVREQRVDAVSR